MDQGNSLEAATLRKGEQYDTAVRAVQRGQRSVRFSARTVPQVFGVSGSVDHTDILFHLSPFQQEARQSSGSGSKSCSGSSLNNDRLQKGEVGRDGSGGTSRQQTTP